MLLAIITLVDEAKAEANCVTNMQCLKPIDANSKETLVNGLIEQGFTRDEIMKILAIAKKD